MLAAAIASGGDAGEFAVDFVILASINVVFFVAWANWEKRDRAVGFDRVWLGVVLVGALAFMSVLLATGGAFPFAAFVSLGPTLVITLIWLGLLRLPTRP